MIARPVRSLLFRCYLPTHPFQHIFPLNCSKIYAVLVIFYFIHQTCYKIFKLHAIFFLRFTVTLRFNFDDNTFKEQVDGSKMLWVVSSFQNNLSHGCFVLDYDHTDSDDSGAGTCCNGRYGPDGPDGPDGRNVPKPLGQLLV